jgi:hypothetical protein
MHYALGQKPTDKQIAFAASIVYKKPAEKDKYSDKGRKYFSVKEMKLSASPAKEHDKRYTEVTDIHDGSNRSIFRILVPEYSDGLIKYNYAHAIRAWVEAQDDKTRRGNWMERPAEFLGWFKNQGMDSRRAHDLVSEIDSAYHAATCVCQSYNVRDSAIRSIECYLRNAENRKRFAREETARAEAAAAAAEPSDTSAA